MLSMFRCCCGSRRFRFVITCTGINVAGMSDCCIVVAGVACCPLLMLVMLFLVDVGFAFAGRLVDRGLKKDDMGGIVATGLGVGLMIGIVDGG